jgi:hypothetical protein
VVKVKREEKKRRESAGDTHIQRRWYCLLLLSNGVERKKRGRKGGRGHVRVSYKKRNM